MGELLLRQGCLLEKRSLNSLEETLCLPIVSTFLDSEEEKEDTVEKEDEERDEGFCFLNTDSSDFDLDILKPSSVVLLSDSSLKSSDKTAC